MRAITRTLVRCLVCGFGEVHTDEVVDRGVVFLARCPRCDHRWTSPEPFAAEAVAVARPPRRARREAASAA